MSTFYFLRRLNLDCRCATDAVIAACGLAELSDVRETMYFNSHISVNLSWV
jgi:hypothetical protein